MDPDRFETIPKTGFAMQWDGTRRRAKQIAKWIDPEKSRFQDGNSIQYYEKMGIDGPERELSINLPGLRCNLVPGNWLVMADADNSERAHFEVLSDEYFKEMYRRPV